MTGLALVLVLASACIHASWNFLAKRAHGGTIFVWLVAALSVILYGPLAIAFMVIQRPPIGWLELGFIAGSAVLHLTYFLLLQSGYRSGDLSLVYPLARGTGPMLSTTAAIMFFGEHPTPVALVGALLVGVGVFLLAGRPRDLRHIQARSAVLYGLLTGMLIAIYTLWDKHAVSILLIPPLVLDYGASFGRMALLTPLVLYHREQIRIEWCTHRWEALGVAVLSPLAYILVLTALMFTPVSYVAPAREMSILIGAAMGTRLLAEDYAPRRLTAAGALVVGVIALALG